MFFLPLGDPIQKRLHGSSPATHPALVGSRQIIFLKPSVKVFLQTFDTVVDLFPQSDLIKLVKHSFVEAFADAVCLRRFHLRLRVIDVVNGEKQEILSNVVDGE